MQKYETPTSRKHHVFCGVPTCCHILVEGKDVNMCSSMGKYARCTNRYC